jgi:AhpD family alkylhydroperoxidase
VVGPHDEVLQASAPAHNLGLVRGSRVVNEELLGLVASMVLRCNDCIDYHMIQCVEAGFTDAELEDAMNVALVVGGSIVIDTDRSVVALRAEQNPCVLDKRPDIDGADMRLAAAQD